ncbi:MAG: hypothetical protein ACKO9I_15095 [Sphaerospermopsis kisseleviana]|nr:hypothetical protein [Sphaerospermopsis reniformis]
MGNGDWRLGTGDWVINLIFPNQLSTINYQLSPFAQSPFPQSPVTYHQKL